MMYDLDPLDHPRPEGKEVSPWKGKEEGHGGCCRPLWISSVELQGHS